MVCNTSIVGQLKNDNIVKLAPFWHLLSSMMTFRTDLPILIGFRLLCPKSIITSEMKTIGSSDVGSISIHSRNVSAIQAKPHKWLITTLSATACHMNLVRGFHQDCALTEYMHQKPPCKKIQQNIGILMKIQHFNLVSWESCIIPQERISEKRT